MHPLLVSLLLLREGSQRNLTFPLPSLATETSNGLVFLLGTGNNFRRARPTDKYKKHTLEHWVII